MIDPNWSLAAGQHCPSQQFTPGVQQALVAGPLSFRQMTPVVAAGQVPQVPVVASWQNCSNAQHTLPHAWFCGQQAPFVHTSFRSQQTSLQH